MLAQRLAGRLQKTGAVLMILCAAAHLAGHIASAGQKAVNEPELRLLELMGSYRFPQLGRTMQELSDGFSLTFSVMFAAMGMLAWQATRRGLIVIAVAMLCESAIGLRYWFVAPNSFIVSAALCFIAALILDAKPSAPDSSA
jgi:hypothetical protein